MYSLLLSNNDTELSNRFRFCPIHHFHKTPSLFSDNTLTHIDKKDKSKRKKREDRLDCNDDAEEW